MAPSSPSSAPAQIVVMGVSGSGKSLIGSLIAQRAGWRFVDADDLHPQSNTTKMEAGIPLDDADRWPWLDAVGEVLADDRAGVVVACSALRVAYRDRLRQHAPGAFFVMLEGSEGLIRSRMAARIGHFMPVTLLASQLATLEPLGPDENGVTLSIETAPEQLAAQALDALKAPEPA